MLDARFQERKGVGEKGWQLKFTQQAGDVDVVASAKVHNCDKHDDSVWMRLDLRV